MTHRTLIQTPYGDFERRGRRQFHAVSVFVVSSPLLIAGKYLLVGNYAPVWHRVLDQVVHPISSTPWGEYVGTYGVRGEKLLWKYSAERDRWFLVVE